MKIKGKANIPRLRNDFGAISPVTKIIPNKKKNPKIKHKKRAIDSTLYLSFCKFMLYL